MKRRFISMALLVLALGMGAASASETIMKRARCVACHAVDKKVVGPAFKDVAAKYKGQPDAPARLARKVRDGGGGVWGEIPMPPNGADKISDADLESMIGWVLSRSE